MAQLDLRDLDRCKRETIMKHGYCSNCRFRDDPFRCHPVFFGKTKEMPCRDWEKRVEKRMPNSKLKLREVRHVYRFSGGISEDQDLYPHERERNAEQRGYDRGWNAAIKAMKELKC